MRYNGREEVERIGVAGSYYELDGDQMRARVLSSFWLICDPGDQGFTPHMTHKAEGFWESWITYWMSQNVKPGARVIDIGANMGYYAMFLADHGCEVIAVEPQPHLAGLIKLSAEANHFKVRVDENAIANAQGSLSMRVPVGHGMNASIAYDPFSPSGLHYDIEVPVYTLNDYCEGKQYYDFVKVDVEGAEAALLAGSKKFIEENPECVFLLEWREDRMDPADASAAMAYMFDTFNVTYVNYRGHEDWVMGPDHLSTKQNEDWMLVLRKKP